MFMTRRSLCALFAASGWLVATSAGAEPTTTSVADNGDYSYRFSDEDLLGDTLSEVGDMYRSRPKFARVLLLRPRTSLVVELVESAEQL
ncbi:MAG TPA: hypothetical protein VIV60_07085 [Polyangiaceae bacterium]